MEKARDSLRKVIIGIWLLAIPVSVGAILIAKQPLPYVLGEIVGCLTGSILMFHMYVSIKSELDMPEGNVSKHATLMSFVRAGIVILAFGVSIFFTNYVNPITVLVGMLGIKIAALLVPFWDKLRGRKEME